VDLRLVALAGCTAMGVADILQRKRQDLLDLEINISDEQDDDPPGASITFTSNMFPRDGTSGKKPSPMPSSSL
jgi:uncharacterized OsmC-like protein